MVSIFCGHYNTFVMTNENKIYSFGWNRYGELAHGTTNIPTLINYQFNGNPVDIQPGGHHSMILTNTSKVYGFGRNNFGQLGLGHVTDKSVPTLINQSLNGIPIDVELGGYYSLILTDTNKVYSFGDNRYGQLGLGDTVHDFYSVPTLINYSFNGNIINIQQGYRHTLILTNNGKVYSFGYNYRGQLGIGNTTDKYSPVLLNYSFDGIPIKAQQGYYHSLILTDTGKVYSFGYNNNGQLGLGDTTTRTTPTLINYQFNGKPINIQQGYQHSMILTDTGKVYSFGQNNYGQLGLGDTTNRNTPTLIDFQFEGHPIDIQVGLYHSLVLTDNDKIYVTGYNYYGQLGLGDNDNRYAFSEIIFNPRNLTIFQESPEAGIIKLNDQIISIPYLKKIESDTNITVEQIPKEGYEFLGWEEI